VINIQLNYNINQALDPEFWNGDFYTVSLHSFIEHLASDIKNIKDSLSRMCKYVLGKSINNDKANDIKDLEDVGKVAWEFLSVIYEAYWDSLYMDNSKTSFRNKVKSKFNPQVNRVLVSSKGKDVTKSTYVSPLPPPIPAKSPKEVNKILKYFKKMKNNHRRNHILKFLPNLTCQTSQWTP